jgi:hypothetical protein
MPAPTNTSQNLAVRCAGCHRRIGWASNQTALRNSVYCSEWCATQSPTTPMEARNDQWRALVAMGRSPVEVSRIYGVAHSLVYRTLAR